MAGIEETVAAQGIEISQLRSTVHDLTVAVRDLTVQVTRLVTYRETDHTPDTCPHAHQLDRLAGIVEEHSKALTTAQGGGKVLLYVATALVGFLSSVATLLLRHVIGGK